MKTSARQNILAASLIGVVIYPTALIAQDTVKVEGSKAANLALQLKNPVADLVTAALENNGDFGFGSTNARSYTFSFKLIYPIHLPKKWNLITRTTLPFIYLESPVTGGPNKSGLGDASETLFFSPAKLFNGWVFAGGPIFQIPTATDPLFGAGKWDAGPALVALRQTDTWTYGILVNHVWSLAGNESRSEVNATECFPLLAYTNRSQWTYTIQADSFYDWTGDQWTIPVEIQLAKLVVFGKQSVEFLLAIRKYVATTYDGPDWGMGINITLLFPN